MDNKKITSSHYREDCDFKSQGVSMNWKFWVKEQSCMEKEIFEQAQIAQTILDSYINKDGSINIETPSEINRIIIVASGSSYHCARYAAEIFGSISKIEARAVYSSEFLLEETIFSSTIVFHSLQAGHLPSHLPDSYPQLLHTKTVVFFLAI